MLKLSFYLSLERETSPALRLSQVKDVCIPETENLKSLLLLEKVPAAAGECGGDT